MPSLARRRARSTFAAFVRAHGRRPGGWPPPIYTITRRQDRRQDGGRQLSSASSPPGGVLEAGSRRRSAADDDWSGTEWRFDKAGPRRPPATSRASTRKTTYKAAGRPSRRLQRHRAGQPGELRRGLHGPGNQRLRGRDEATSTSRPMPSTSRRPAQNHDLPESCGIDVILVLDESGSIGTGANREAVRRPRGRSSTRSRRRARKVSIVDFSTRARTASRVHDSDRGLG